MALVDTGYGIFWTEAMNQFEEELSEQEFTMWFNRMSYIRSDDSAIVVSVPSSFYRDQVKQRYLSALESLYGKAAPATGGAPGDTEERRA